MKYGGLTTFANIFTDSEYKELSLKLGLLFMQLLTVLMIFYGRHGRKYFEDATRKHLVTAAGICGMIYASSALVDCFVRLKHMTIRIFDEISLIAACSCLWLLVFILFEKLSLPFLGISLLLIIIGIAMAVRESNGNVKGGKITPRMREIIAELSGRGDPNDVLKLAALMVLITKPDDPEAEEFSKAVIAAHHNAADKISQSDSAKNGVLKTEPKINNTAATSSTGVRKNSSKVLNSTAPSTGVTKATSEVPHFTAPGATKTAAKPTAGDFSTNV